MLDLNQHRLQVEPVGGDLHRNLLEVTGLMEIGGQRPHFEDEDERSFDHVLARHAVRSPSRRTRRAAGGRRKRAWPRPPIADTRSVPPANPAARRSNRSATKKKKTGAFAAKITRLVRW